MGWQALQVTDFKDPHYPAVCLITRRSQVQILPPLPIKSTFGICPARASVTR
jgi:hypothetical protein